VIGLSCAWELVEAGHTIRLVADREPADTTSAVAAAIWYPYLAEPRDRVSAWGATTYQAFENLGALEPESGIRMLPGVELFVTPQPDPWWAPAVPDLRRLPPSQLPMGMEDGWTFTSPVVDMPVYLAWLRARLADRGIHLKLQHVTDLEEHLGQSDVVINCTGLGSRTLANDPLLEPVRGQVVITTNPGITSWWLHDAGPAELMYVVPRRDTVVVGGSAERGAADLTPDPATAAAIVARAQALVPALADADVVRHSVGVRPARPEVRLKREERSAGAIVHCYGHGGAGVTLSWGCAREVAELVAR
jgi:D-amino-acid oxidase